MKKQLKDFQQRAIKDLSKIKGGTSGPIDRDKVKLPKAGKI